MTVSLKKLFIYIYVHYVRNICVYSTRGEDSFIFKILLYAGEFVVRLINTPTRYFFSFQITVFTSSWVIFKTEDRVQSDVRPPCDLAKDTCVCHHSPTQTPRNQSRHTRTQKGVVTQYIVRRVAFHDHRDHPLASKEYFHPNTQSHCARVYSYFSRTGYT